MTASRGLCLGFRDRDRRPVRPRPGRLVLTRGEQSREVLLGQALEPFRTWPHRLRLRKEKDVGLGAAVSRMPLEAAKVRRSPRRAQGTRYALRGTIVIAAPGVTPNIAAASPPLIASAKFR